MSANSRLFGLPIQAGEPVPQTPVPPIGIGTGGTGYPSPPTSPPLKPNGTCPETPLGRVGTGRDGYRATPIEHLDMDVRRVLGALDYFGPLDVKSLAAAVAEPISLAIRALDRAKELRLVTRNYPYWSLTDRAYSLAPCVTKESP